MTYNLKKEKQKTLQTSKSDLPKAESRGIGLEWKVFIVDSVLKIDSPKIKRCRNQPRYIGTGELKYTHFLVMSTGTSQKQPHPHSPSLVSKHPLPMKENKPLRRASVSCRRDRDTWSIS